MELNLKVFSPDTVDSQVGRNGSKRIAFNKRNGQISISPAASDFFLKNEHGDKFNIVYYPKENTAYIIPDEKGFQFKFKKNEKGLSYFNKNLIAAVLGAHEPNPALNETSVKFTIGERGVLKGYEYAFPLILVR